MHSLIQPTALPNHPTNKAKKQYRNQITTTTITKPSFIDYLSIRLPAVVVRPPLLYSTLLLLHLLGHCIRLILDDIA